MKNNNEISDFIHPLPEDLKKIIDDDKNILQAWNDLTPLAQNEWICWVTIVKKPETRTEHMLRFSKELVEGKKRPCCWPGCPHRRKSAQKWFK